MKKVIRLTALILLLTTFNICIGQKKTDFSALPIFTADSLATGNYKDLLSSFFQLAFDNLTGKNKELKFTSNPFAVMVKMNPHLLIDTIYYKYRHLRRLNFAFAGKLDSGYRFNGFSSSISYALIDQRDITVSRQFVSAAYRANDEYNKLNNRFAQLIARINNIENKIKLNNLRDSIFHDTTGRYQFNKLPDSIQNLLRTWAAEENAVNFLKLINDDPTFSIYKQSRFSYDSVKNIFENKLLWTVGISDTTYNDQFMFSNLVLSTNLLKGYNASKNKNLELDIKSYFSFLDDTLKSGRDLNRKLFTFEPGVNLVLKSGRTHQSVFEFKLSGSYKHVFSGLYQNEDKDQLMFNGTLRIRVYNDIWIPLQFKYDPKTEMYLDFLV